MEKLYFNDFEFFRKCFAFLRETLHLLAKPLQKSKPKTLRKTIGSLCEIFFYEQTVRKLCVRIAKPHKTFLFA